MTRELANNWNWLMPLRRPLPGDARRRTATRNASPGPFGAPGGLRSENVGYSDYRLAFFMNSFYDTNDVLSSSRRTSSVSLQRYMPACGLCAIGLSSSFRWHSGESFDQAEDLRLELESPHWGPNRPWGLIPVGSKSKWTPAGPYRPACALIH